MVILKLQRLFSVFYGPSAHRSARNRASVSAMACLLLCYGCTGPRSTPPDIDPNTLDDDGFQAWLGDVPLVTVDEAYRAMLILADGEDTSKSFDERRGKLESRKIARSAWNLEPANVIDTGSVAYMVTKICRISGGVNNYLFGSWGLGDRRYALRELVYLQMIDDSVDYQYLTGSALIALMAKADELMEKKGLYEVEPIDLSDETDRDPEGNLIVPEPLPVPPPADTQPGTMPTQPDSNQP
jgi:hypothetical protein